MRVIHFSHNLFDGAGRAAYRLHKALREEGVESIILVYKKTVEDDSVVQLSDAHLVNDINPIKSNADIFKRGMDFLPFIFKQVRCKLIRHRCKPLTLFNFNIPYVSIAKIKKYLDNADIVCLHSIQSFLSSGVIREIHSITKAPVVWTLMDIEPLTGGCHFNNGCGNFSNSCGDCPQLGESKKDDISRKIWNRKNTDFKNVPIVPVAASSWVYGHIKKSSLFGGRRIENIALSVDHRIFKEIDKEVARKILNLPREAKIVLFGCFDLNDKRKGGEYLKKALSVLSQKLGPDNKKVIDSILLLTFGRINGFSLCDVPFNWKHLGMLKDDIVMALAYQAADVLACPSVDDFGPLMVSEAFMCGLPVVAFNQGVAPDLVKSPESGYIARLRDSDDFAAGLAGFLLTGGRRERSPEAESLKQRCMSDFQARQYHNLFKQLLHDRREQ